MWDLPLYWRVEAVDGQKEAIDLPGHRNPEMIREKYDQEAPALARKIALQAAGMIACMVPVYSSARARTAMHRKMQTNPFGEFAKGWKMAR